jgi:hypothetical protein
VTDRVTEGITESVTERVTQGATDWATESVTEGATQGVTEGVTESVLCPVQGCIGLAYPLVSVVTATGESGKVIPNAWVMPGSTLQVF